MWRMLGTQKGAAAGSAACSAASRCSAVHRPHVPRAGAERRLQARRGGGCLWPFRRALRPAARCAAAFHHRPGRPLGSPRGAGAGRGLQCEGPARGSAAAGRAAAGCAAHAFQPVRPGFCKPAAARTLAIGEPGRRMGRSAGPRRHACCRLVSACVHPIRDIASCRLYGGGAAGGPPRCGGSCDAGPSCQNQISGSEVACCACLRAECQPAGPQAETAAAEDGGSRLLSKELCCAVCLSLRASNSVTVRVTTVTA
jgi:hypothetical protein